MHKRSNPEDILSSLSVSISMHIHPPPQLENISQARHFFTFFLVGVLKIMFKPPYI
ncbi:hypothetical protein Bca4012_086943 [Brassica carinata]